MMPSRHHTHRLLQVLVLLAIGLGLSAVYRDFSNRHFSCKPLARTGYRGRHQTTRVDRPLHALRTVVDNSEQGVAWVVESLQDESAEIRVAARTVAHELMDHCRLSPEDFPRRLLTELVANLPGADARFRRDAQEILARARTLGLDTDWEVALDPTAAGEKIAGTANYLKPTSESFEQQAHPVDFQAAEDDPAHFENQFELPGGNVPLHVRTPCEVSPKK